MCTVRLPPGDNPIAVNKYIISYQILSPIHEFNITFFCDVIENVLSIDSALFIQFYFD